MVHHWMAVHDLNDCVWNMDAVLEILVVVGAVYDGETRSCWCTDRVSFVL